MLWEEYRVEGLSAARVSVTRTRSPEAKDLHSYARKENHDKKNHQLRTFLND